MASYSLTPVDVPFVNTRYRTIKTPIPVPESLEFFESLKESEPESMMGQPPVVWDRADNFTIYDRWGNRWIDWSSGVLIANAGHGRKEIAEALKKVIDKPLLSTSLHHPQTSPIVCLCPFPALGSYPPTLQTMENTLDPTIYPLVIGWIYNLHTYHKLYYQSYSISYNSDSLLPVKLHSDKMALS